MALRHAIDERLVEFAALGATGDERSLFREMCFCLCTPQTNAHYAWDTISALATEGSLYDAPSEVIAAALRSGGVRFHNIKANAIIRARTRFWPATREILTRFFASTGSPSAARDILAQEVTGWGLKEASHFLRNIGLGASMCILDRHILRCLAREGVIASIPKSLSPNLYHSIEQAMLSFAASIGIRADALDILFWHEETGEIFK
jgi:N-glycosylase/DNA lyase